jgi:hypothetical protein
MLSLSPVIFSLVNLIVLNVSIKAILGNFPIDDPTIIENTLKYFNSLYFPFTINISIMASSGLYVLNVVQDREDKLRYLLNFTGMKPLAYYLGLLLGDFLIFMVPAVLLIFLSGLLGIDQFYQAGPEIFVAFLFYSLPFVLVNYLIAFIFDKIETAFKYQFLILTLIGYVPYGLATALLNPEKAKKVKIAAGYLLPWTNFNNLIGIAMNKQGSDSPLGPPDEEEVEEIPAYNYYIGLCVQTCIFMGLVLLIDRFQINSFKGVQRPVAIKERVQLDEHQDVIA